LFRCRYSASKGFFLLAEFTAPYAASIKQQFVQLFYGEESGNEHLPEIEEGGVIQRHGLFRLFV